MAASSALACVVSCEHATNQVPAAYRSCFADPAGQARLASHRGWDAGAADLARALAQRLDAPLHLARVSRLVVDANRSPRHPRLHDATVRALPAAERARLVTRYHEPHVEAVAASVADALAIRAEVLHLSVHSFTPVLDGQVRRVDLGLLYDPAHGREGALAARWGASLARATGLRVRRNQPYRGRDDGLTRTLRRRFDPPYAGIELEVNQALLVNERVPAALRRILGDTLAALLAAPDHAPDA